LLLGGEFSPLEPISLKKQVKTYRITFKVFILHSQSLLNFIHILIEIIQFQDNLVR